jgi:6-phosphogluconolactonase
MTYFCFYKKILMKLFKILLPLIIMNCHAQDNLNLIVGTYTNNCNSKGIYVYNFNTATAEFKLKNNTDKVINPSYLAVSPDGKYIYSVNENGDDSTISAFTYNAATGAINFINKKDAKGADPCYIICDEKNVIAANYSGSTIAVFERKEDGSITAARQVIKRNGGSIDKSRQEKPHPHMVYFSPDKKHVFANDLGTDHVIVYSYDPDSKNDNFLKAEYALATKPGSGPRHLAFHASGVFFYVLGELDASLTAYSYVNGKIEKVQEVSLVRDPLFTGKNGAADIHLSNDGKFLYATNRGDANTITVFRVHANGRLGFVQQESTCGVGPRNFAITPNDNYILIGYQQTNDIMIFKRDKVTGMIEDTGKKIEVCSPVCLLFTGSK